MNGTCNGTLFWGPHPWGLGEGSNIIKSELQSQFQRFLNQTLCIFSQRKIYKISNGSSFGRLGHAKVWDLGVPWGSKIVFPKFNQIWCVCNEWHMQQHNFWAAPGALGRGQISLNLNYKANFKDF